jgi:hypothetical protein
VRSVYTNPISYCSPSCVCFWNNLGSSHNYPLCIADFLPAFICLNLWNISATIVETEVGPIIPDSRPGMSRNQRNISRWARPLCRLGLEGSLLNLLHPDITRHFLFHFVQSVRRRKWRSVSCCFSVWNVRVWVKLRVFVMWKFCYMAVLEWTECRPASTATIYSYYQLSNYSD